MSAKTLKPKVEDSRKYLYELVAEHFLGSNGVKFQYISQAMRNGIEREPEAREAFARRAKLHVEPAGICTTDDGMLRCSPDGFIEGTKRKEAIEIKCPEPHTHCGYLLDGPEEAYACQVQGQILIGGFRCVHFWSWHPDMPPYYRMTEPDSRILVPLKACLKDFVRDLEAAKAKMARIMAGMSNERAMGVLEELGDVDPAAHS